MSKNEIYCPLECGLKILDLEKHLQKCKRKKQFFIYIILKDI